MQKYLINILSFSLWEKVKNNKIAKRKKMDEGYGKIKAPRKDQRAFIIENYLSIFS